LDVVLTVTGSLIRSIRHLASTANQEENSCHSNVMKQDAVSEKKRIMLRWRRYHEWFCGLSITRKRDSQELSTPLVHSAHIAMRCHGNHSGFNIMVRRDRHEVCFAASEIRKS
jgi:hypothetical protein